MSHGWWWHLLYDPICDNPWSLLATILLVGGPVIGMVAHAWWCYSLGRRRLGSEVSIEPYGFIRSDVHLSDEEMAEIRTRFLETVSRPHRLCVYGDKQLIDIDCSCPPRLCPSCGGPDISEPLLAGPLKLPAGEHVHGMAQCSTAGCVHCPTAADGTSKIETSELGSEWRTFLS